MVGVEMGVLAAGGLPGRVMPGKLTWPGIAGGVYGMLGGVTGRVAAGGGVTAAGGGVTAAGGGVTAAGGGFTTAGGGGAVAVGRGSSPTICRKVNTASSFFPVFN